MYSKPVFSEKPLLMPTVKVKNIVRDPKGYIPFLQPVYEAIVNALETNASLITVDIFANNENFDCKKKVTGFVVTDNGIGFTSENRASFCEYKSDYKIDLGCKGVGRYTWLKVFDEVKIESFTGKERVFLTFAKNFDEGEIKNIEEHISQEPKTCLSFLKVSKEYEKKRIAADVEKVKHEVEKYLLAKLFLLSRNKKKFEIRFNLDEKSSKITNENLLNLEEEIFEIEEEIGENKKKHKFRLYYNFAEKKGANCDMWYCANGRTVTNFHKDITSFSGLPDNYRMSCLLISEYFDERVNNERNAFICHGQSKPTIENPITFFSINASLKEKIDKIILKKYPEIEINNKKIIEECINENPHLTNFINEDPSLIKNKKHIVKNATSKYLKEKDNVRDKFVKLLEKRDLDSKEFYKVIYEISNISARELSQYFAYRQQIINALGELNSDFNKQEKLLHDLFMRRGDISGASNNTYDTNIWLLDDKYMSYEQMFSDKQIKTIKEALAKENLNSEGERYEPDLAIFYSKNGRKDVVVVEFKSIGAKPGEKSIAFSEISRNLGVICKSIDGINVLYGYIITKLDEKFRSIIEMQPGVKKMFSANEKPLYYIYNENLRDKNGDKKDGHIYILDTELLWSDADARNKVFLDIIKHS